MRYAIIENGKVTNIVTAPAELAAAQGWIESDTAEINDDYIDGAFRSPSVDTAPLAAQARERRNALLASSDWTQINDAPVNKVAWATYRQALRDIPAQQGFPLEVQWPVQPE